MRLPVLGVDIGGVIVDRAAEDTDTAFFGNRPMETPVVTGAIDALRALTKETFQWRVHLVSKARRQTAATTRAWLEHIEFFERTGIERHHLHFVQNRRDKDPVCTRLGVTHFIDDRLDVLTALTTVRHRFLFIGGLGENEPPTEVPDDVRVIATWPDLQKAIVATI